MTQKPRKGDFNKGKNSKNFTGVHASAVWTPLEAYALGARKTVSIYPRSEPGNCFIFRVCTCLLETQDGNPLSQLKIKYESKQLCSGYH